MNCFILIIVHVLDNSIWLLSFTCYKYYFIHLIFQIYPYTQADLATESYANYKDKWGPGYSM